MKEATDVGRSASAIGLASISIHLELGSHEAANDSASVAMHREQINNTSSFFQAPLGALITLLSLLPTLSLFDSSRSLTTSEHEKQIMRFQFRELRGREHQYMVRKPNEVEQKDRTVCFKTLASVLIQQL